MSISISNIRQNLVELNEQKKNLNEETKDVIERVTDDMLEVIEYFDSILADIKR